MGRDLEMEQFLDSASFSLDKVLDVLANTVGTCEAWIRDKEGFKDTREQEKFFVEGASSFYHFFVSFLLSNYGIKPTEERVKSLKLMIHSVANIVAEDFSRWKK